jgi:hypothetical protein
VALFHVTVQHVIGHNLILRRVSGALRAPLLKISELGYSRKDVLGTVTMSVGLVGREISGALAQTSTVVGAYT